MAVRLGRLAWIASVAVVVYCIAQIFPSLDLIAGAVLFGSLLLSVQGLFSVHLMLYAWEHRERLAQSCVPRSRSAPKLTFTVLLPARHAEAVIYEAIQRIVTARYPQTLIEVIVLCHADDRGTIAETVRAIESLRLTNVRLHTIDAGPLSTSHGLRLGSQQASNEIVTIFNANDDVDPDIFNVINAAMQRGDVNIVRSSVRLMRFRAGWFAMSEGLLSRSWLDRPTVGQRLLALWTLSYPFFHALASAIWPIAILTVFFPDLPVTVLALSSLPLLALIFQCTVSVIGTYAFAAAYGRGVPVTAPWAMAVTFRPYQWLRGRSAPRAVWCERRRQIAREETEHQTGCA